MAISVEPVDWQQLYSFLVEKYRLLEGALIEKDRALTRSVREERIKGKIETIQNFLPIIDSIKRVQSASETTGEHAILIEGIDLILREVDTILSSLGAEPTQAEKGQLFDPKIHEAVSLIQSETIQKDHIVEVVQRGYLFKEKLLRPAKVVVSSGPDK